LGFLTVVELVAVVVGGGCNVDEFRVSVLDAGYDLRGVGDVRNWRLVVSDISCFGVTVLVDAVYDAREMVAFGFW